MTKEDLVYWICESGVRICGIEAELLGEYLHGKFKHERTLIYKDGYEQGRFDERMEQYQRELERTK